MSDYLNSDLPIETRVDDLIRRMTLEEKILQMVHEAPAIERLGVPAYNWWNEGLHGVGRAGVATVFPQAIGLAATWDPQLIREVADAVSDEARAKHHEALRRDIHSIYTGLTFWSPNVNIFRDPRWGRGQETFGEDPYLSALLGVQFIEGLQGDDPRYLKLVATAKHYAVHSGPESSRHHFDARVNERDLRETYLPQFEACVRDGHVRSVMGAYNRTNGEACCASPTLLQKILREEWGFDGYVVSDCWAILDIYAHHKLVATPEEAAALAVNNGCELNCGSTYPALIGAVAQGLISEETIDEAVRRLFTSRFQLGMFDSPEQVPYAAIPYEIINSPDHQALALRAAQESIVLLKNDGNLLPLSKDIDSIAIIGPNADDMAALIGNYNGTPANASSPLMGIREKVPSKTRVYYSRGCAIADGIPSLEVIPPTFLRPMDTAQATTGLSAAYYAKPDFAGEPVRQQVEPVVDVVWKNTTPITGEWGDSFSVRWNGFLVPPVSGRYTIGVNGFSSFRLFIDDEQVVTYEDIHHPRIKSIDLDLEAGRFYALRLDFVNRGLDPQVQLLWARPDTDYEAEALEAAGKSDVVVAVMGLSANLEGEEISIAVDGFFGGDRTDIGLPRPQQDLLQKLSALGKPIVLVLMSGSALAVDWAADHIPAIVEAWYPGEAGGAALADVLFGDTNPSGRLAVTFYKSVDDLPPFEDYAMDGRTYRYFEGRPLFAFGHGLSFTTFTYDNLILDKSELGAGETVTISVDVTNIGRRAGDEVVQLYTRQFVAPPRPIKELKGFARITLLPGECQTVTFTLHANQLGVYDEEMLHALLPGEVEVMVGKSSADIQLCERLEITGTQMGISHQKVYFSRVTVQ